MKLYLWVKKILKCLQQEERVYVGEGVEKKEDSKECCQENHSPHPYTAKCRFSKVISEKRYLL